MAIASIVVAGQATLARQSAVCNDAFQFQTSIAKQSKAPSVWTAPADALASQQKIVDEFNKRHDTMHLEQIHREKCRLGK